MRGSRRHLAIVSIAAMLCLVGCASAPQQAATASGNQASQYLPIPPEFESAVREAETSGRQLYERDRAAEKATDLLVATGDLKLPSGRFAGWLIGDLGEGRYHVSYLVEQDGQPRSFAEADYSTATDRASNPVRLSPPRVLDPLELAQATAIRTAQTGELLRCVEKYNVVTALKEADNGTVIHVYLIPSRERLDEFPQGGFHDVTVSSDGKTIIDHYSQTKACLNAKASDDKGTLVSLMSSHITSPSPTLFHVFMHLNYRMNVFTVTTQNKMLWSISQGHINLVSNDVSNKK